MKFRNGMAASHTPSLALVAMLAAAPAFSAPESRPALTPAPMPPAGQATPLFKQVPMLSPEEELKTIQLPAGYRLELVLSEPDIKEPMAIAFDGNGRMYVVEMRTYMQDIEGT